MIESFKTLIFPLARLPFPPLVTSYLTATISAPRGGTFPYLPSPNSKSPLIPLNLNTLSLNELHRCPFSAQITRLGVCDEKEDYIDLTDFSDLITKRDEIHAFLDNKNSLKACDFCPGRPLHDPQIIPAIQIKTPLPYKRNIVCNVEI